MTSIRQNQEHRYVPDFRNLGVIFRILIGVNLMAAAAALLRSDSLAGWWQQYIDVVFFVEALLFANLLLCIVLRDLFWILPGRLGQILMIAATAVLTPTLVSSTGDWWFTPYSVMPEPAYVALLTMMIGIVLLAYFESRSRRLSPALTEARLRALTARIRPHFLFNSLNAVLSIIRSDPRRAEVTLEELAELFRALMRDQRDLVPLSEEITFCKQYLNIEKLRLGDRLNIDWTIDCPGIDPHIPPLMLQPLLENAVYHGIEPSSEGGTIEVHLIKTGNELRIEISNPYPKNSSATLTQPPGNRLALNNIRERLVLYYDLEAHLEIHANDRFFRVRITIPCRT